LTLAYCASHHPNMKRAANSEDLDTKIKKRLAELVPPGTPMTPDLQEKAIVGLRELLKDELAERKIPPAFVDLIVTTALRGLKK
jgi:hypothetical protein